MGNANCNNCTNLENNTYHKKNLEILEIINNDSYISFEKETDEPKLEENNINKLTNTSKQSENGKKEEEEHIILNDKQNGNYYENNFEQKIENINDNDKKEIIEENYKIPKKEMPSSKIENKTRNIVNDLAEMSNGNNNTIQIKTNNNEENSNEIIDNNSQKSEPEEEKEIKEEKEEKHINNFNNNLIINDMNHNGNKVELNIYNIFPKDKLMNLEDNSILCHGLLEKIIKIPTKNKFIYNERFCILTKKTFAYYKSKENYLNLWKPLFSIDLKHIKKVEQTVSDDKIFYFGLICIINDKTRHYLNKINTFVNSNEKNNEEFLIGFRSKNKELIIKWIIILNYFIQNYDNNI